MNSFEINKIITAILVTILVVFGIGKISDIIFDKDDKNIVAYKVEAPEGEAVQASTESSVDISALLAMGDVAHGEKVYKKCKACHSFDKGGKNKVGPALYGIVGQSKASSTAFNYSTAMKEMGGEWNYEDLDSFLADPKGVLPGTKMAFKGVKKPTERANLIVYMLTKHDSPPALPAE